MKNKRRFKRIFATTMAFLLVCLFLVPQYTPQAKDSFISQYIQTIYNQKNGIGSNEVNCLYQSSSGYVWIGTDGGLYRTDGAGFQSINLWDTERTDVYSINCIIQDREGRMWIGTDNYGLFYIESGSNYHLQDEYYNGIKSIYDLCETPEGYIYVSTSAGLYTVSKSGDAMSLVPSSDERVVGKEFGQIEYFNEGIWATYGTNKVCIIKDNQLTYTIDTSAAVADEIISMQTIGDKIYLGTTGRNIVAYSNHSKYTLYVATVEGINDIMLDSNGFLWVCADNGLGYFADPNTFIKANDCEIDSYLSAMIQDYEGNYWIASTRMGVLLLSRSKFIDYNMYTGMQESMVNVVSMYRGNKYIGTDDGLVIYDNTNERVNNELTDMLNGISIKYIMEDKSGNLWISTYRKYGVVKVDNTGVISYIGRGSGLPSLVINCTLLLSDGNIAVATEEGVGIIGKDGTVIATYEDSQDITYGNVICLYQDDDGTLFFGTDGGGIFAVEPGSEQEVINYTTDDGLNSNVITSMEKGEAGLWIATDNGLCLYNESFRSISNIEYSNSIYDILIDNGRVWIVGSMGVLYSTEEELLGSDGISARYLDANDGLTKTLNTFSNSYIDSKGMLYLCCNDGICVLETTNIPYNNVAPKIKVTAIDVDGEIYEFDDLANGLKIGSDVSKITIDFAVFSYINRSNIQVEYYLKGFDKEPIVISGNDVMRAVYTNLEGGVYEFVINAYNGDGTVCESTVSFVIEKKTSFFEDPIARIGLVTLLIFAIVVFIIGLIWIKRVLTNKNVAIEKLHKEHEEAIKSSSAKNDYLANMSNEIKTPINAMISKADELLHTIGDDEESREKINSICDIGNGIIGKVDDIILLAKIEAGKVDVIKAPYSITTLIYEISERAVKKIGDKSVKFFVEIGEDIIDKVIGDVDKIKDVTERLLDNAIRYTKEGSITLSVDCYRYPMEDSQEEDIVNMVFTISDTGIGIQEDRLDTIFKVYNIADNVKNSTHSGNGVGLAIAKGYAELMDGEIEVESVYGAGSTFTFSLNQKAADKLVGSPNIHKIEGTVSKEIAEKLWLPEVSALLVDDEDVSREVALKLLKQFEMKVDVASSGLNAIDMVMNNDYDVVFMDLSMPIMNGMDAMLEIRELEDDRYSILPIVAMDTDAIEENKAKLLSGGFTDSILKPMDLRRVAAILKDCLPESKIKEKTNDIQQYIEGSRYKEGLEKIGNYIDVEYALEKIGGSIDVFNKLLKSFYNQNQSTSEELYKKAKTDIRGFKVKVHSLRTSAMNAGALGFAQMATKMEAAVNIGNRDYINDNLERFVEELVDILLLLEDYIAFADSVSGMSDEEYANLNKKSEEPAPEEDKNERISIEVLENIKYAALEGDFDKADADMEELSSKTYTGEDNEFIEVLQEAVKSRTVETIDELVTTYIDLKI
ncbi:MAG: response regulator [Lachnospiraceae bacterium]|nr:response regulator [Lachnospiraceae bacterium]